MKSVNIGIQVEENSIINQNKSFQDMSSVMLKKNNYHKSMISVHYEQKCLEKPKNIIKEINEPLGSLSISKISEINNSDTSCTNIFDIFTTKTKLQDKDKDKGENKGENDLKNSDSQFRMIKRFNKKMPAMFIKRPNFNASRVVFFQS